MSIAMLLLASSSWTLISASRRRRESGVRRSCEMPASMTARSCSTLASSRAIRLKPMLTWRISLVIVVSSRRESYSPSRIRLAANERSFSGRLMRRAMPAEPSTVASSAIETQSDDRAGRHRPDPRRVDLEPERVARDREADPEARRAVHRAGDDRVGAELVAQLALDDALEAVDLERLPLVARLARRELHRLERRDALDDGDAVDAVGAEQGGARRC